MRQKAQLLIAFICVILGSIGTIVPLLPTTPFLLVAVYFYSKSSKKRLYRIVRNRYLGPYIIAYYSKRGMPTMVKKRTLIILWISMIVCILLVSGLYIKILLLTIGACVTAHVIMKQPRG